MDKPAQLISKPTNVRLLLVKEDSDTENTRLLTWKALQKVGWQLCPHPRLIQKKLKPNEATTWMSLEGAFQHERKMDPEFGKKAGIELEIKVY